MLTQLVDTCSSVLMTPRDLYGVYSRSSLLSVIAQDNTPPHPAPMSCPFPDEGTCPERASLEQLVVEMFKLVSRNATSGEWVEWLRVPLMHAATHGNRGLVDKLIGAGANGKAGWRGCGGRTLLHEEARGGDEGVVLSLLRAGAQPDVNVLTSAPESLSALWVAVDCDHEAVARRLVTHGADVNFKHPESGHTVLHLAIKGGHEKLAEDLILHGADTRVRDDSGHTLLHLAVNKGLERVVEILLVEGADYDTDNDAVNDQGDTALMSACEKGIPTLIVEKLLTAGFDPNYGDDSGGTTALMLASERGCVPTINALLVYGADVNQKMFDGFSPLHGAAYSDHAGAVDVLVEAGAGIEAECEDRHEVTPLAIAAANGKAKSLLALLRHGASVDAQGFMGQTPLHLACLHGAVAVVDLLLKWGADETIADDEGNTPADKLSNISAAKSDRVRLLLSRAPADRAWRRRGWLVMLLTHASTNDSNGCKVARRDGGATEEDEVFRGAVNWLVGTEPAGVFRDVIQFL